MHVVIYRAKKEGGNFVQIHKDLINDSKLSPLSKGIMIYLLSQNEDWQFYETEIAKHFYGGLKVVRKGMQELIEKGYIEREKTKGYKGRFVYEYYIYETLQVKEKNEKEMNE